MTLRISKKRLKELGVETDSYRESNNRIVGKATKRAKDKAASPSPQQKAFLAACKAHGIPPPDCEYAFAPWEGGEKDCLHPHQKYVCELCGAKKRRFRFDYCWDEIALEVQGAIFTHGRHTRGSHLLSEYEKLNLAVIEGWAVLFCTPSQITDGSIFPVIRRALGLE